MILKVILTAVFGLLIGSHSLAQEPCNRAVAEAPAISGLKLGMSFGEVQQLLGFVSKIKPPKSGDGTIYLSFAEQAPPESLRGVGTLWLRLFENRVYQIEAFYSDAAGDDNVQEFTGMLSKNFQLPKTAWVIKNNFATLDCGEFVIKADTFLNAHVEITDKARKA
jgi:hypothetical protein